MTSSNYFLKKAAREFNSIQSKVTPVRKTIQKLHHQKERKNVCQIHSPCALGAEVIQGSMYMQALLLFTIEKYLISIHQKL